MKKFIPIILFILIALLFTGCSPKKETPTEKPPQGTENPGEEKPTKPSEDEEEPSKEEQGAIEDYYPFLSNQKYIYSGRGNEYASYNVVTDYFDKKSNRVQTRSNNGGTEVVKVMEIKDGKLSIVLSREESYYRDNLLQSVDPKNKKEIVLMEPLVKGTQWTLSDNRKRYISDTEVEITTDIKTYKALEVTTEGGEHTVKDYYAPGVGLVKTIFSQDNAEVISTLQEIKKDNPHGILIDFYYPNADGKIYVKGKTVNFNTNDISRLKIQEAMREDPPKENLSSLISHNTKINTLYLGKDHIAYIDFSKEFIDEMNAGASFESLILQSVTNTIGKYYGVQKVYLTIEGKPYESGHILLKKGEVLRVNMDSVVR